MFKLTFSSGLKLKNQYKDMFLRYNLRNFYYREDHHKKREPEVIAKRVINVIGQRLSEYDPARWEGIPITFETKWVDMDWPHYDIRLCILVHDALEREFNIDIDDKKVLIGSVKQAFGFVMDSHAAL